MPISKENKKRYPPNWEQISMHIRFVRANNKCEFCGARNYALHPETNKRVVLSVAHLDHQPENNDFSNLKALCQRCHLRYDARHHAQTRKQNKIKALRNSGQQFFRF